MATSRARASTGSSKDPHLATRQRATESPEIRSDQIRSDQIQIQIQIQIQVQLRSPLEPSWRKVPALLTYVRAYLLTYSLRPAREVLCDHGDCLLATHMNDEELAPDHGFPCRALLPGIAGARSVKWLVAIRLSDSPTAAPWNATYYKRADGSEVQALPLQSIILQPTPGERVVAAADGTLTVQGVAYNGAGGGAVQGVEVSTNGGGSWSEATLLLLRTYLLTYLLR